MKKISIVINADDRLGHISPEIYGHFSEHLGRCIYNGIFFMLYLHSILNYNIIILSQGILIFQLQMILWTAKAVHTS